MLWAGKFPRLDYILALDVRPTSRGDHTWCVTFPIGSSTQTSCYSLTDGKGVCWKAYANSEARVSQAKARAHPNEWNELFILVVRERYSVLFNHVLLFKGSCRMTFAPWRDAPPGAASLALGTLGGTVEFRNINLYLRQ